MQCGFNLWLNTVACSPGTLTVSELPFHTLLTLAPLKRTVLFATLLHLQRLGGLGSRHGLQGHGSWRRDSGWIIAAPLTPTPTRFSSGKEREGAREKTPFFRFSELQGRKRENSYCRASGTLYLSVGWKAWQENERTRGLFARAQLNERGGWDKVKEFTTSH